MWTYGKNNVGVGKNKFGKYYDVDYIMMGDLKALKQKIIIIIIIINKKQTNET